MSNSTTSPGYFEAKYKLAADPWNFAVSRYELDRYAAIVASLKSRRFERAFEAGCSIGVLTGQLAAFCQHVSALDVSVTAVSRALERCRHLLNVDIGVGSLLIDVPRGSFDLIILSEIGYYFNPEELASIGKALSVRLRPGGILLGAHWLGHSDDHLLSGDEVHGIIGSLPDLDLAFSERHYGYRIDHWTKA